MIHACPVCGAVPTTIEGGYQSLLTGRRIERDDPEVADLGKYGTEFVAFVIESDVLDFGDCPGFSIWLEDGGERKVAHL